MMTKKSLLVLLLGLFLQTTACAEENNRETEKLASSKTTNANADYLTLVPKGTNILFYANLQELRGTPLGEELHEGIKIKLNNKNNADYFEFTEETGLDPDKDINEIFFGSFNRDDDSVSGIIATGELEQKRIAKYLTRERDSSFDEKDYNGYAVFVSTESREHEEIAFLNAHTIVAGDHDWVKTVLDNNDNKSSSILDNQEMGREIKKIRRDNQFWGVMNLAEASHSWADKLKKKSSFRGTDSIKNIQSVIFYTQVGKKANMHVKGNFTTAEEAELLAETITGFKAMAKLLMADDREAIDMLNEIKIGTEGQILEISAKVDKQFFEKFKEKRDVLSNGPVKLL